MTERQRQLRSERFAEHMLSERQMDLLELRVSGLLESAPSAAPLDLPPTRPLALRDREGIMLAVVWEDERIETVDPIHRYDFLEHRVRPRPSDRPLLAFAARQPIHRREVEALRAAAKTHGARILVVGDSSSPDYFVRVRCLRAALAHLPEAQLFLAPLSAWGDESSLDALVAKNLGASLFLPVEGRACECPGIHILEPAPRSFEPATLAEILRRGAPLPGGATYPEVEVELRRAFPLRHQRGFTVFFTGLSGSGKSTIGNILREKLEELGPRRVTFLDGDVVRTHLSHGLGFSKVDRDVNIRRIGFVASEITKHGGIAICAPIAPYESTRNDVRDMVETYGGFTLVHVATPLEECERRDRKGLYAKARRGEITSFTGIDDPYEEPTNAEVVIDTSKLSREEAVDRIMTHLRNEAFLSG
jgi:sulfate adenylyltransferase